MPLFNDLMNDLKVYLAETCVIWRYQWRKITKTQDGWFNVKWRRQCSQCDR